ELNIQVGQDDLTERLVVQSRQYGIEPQQLLQYLQENNQLPAMFADVRRGKALAAVVQGATVTDTDGNPIDTDEFFGTRPQPEGAEPEGAQTQPAGEAAATGPAASEPEASETAATEPGASETKDSDAN
ncbi:MAG TPA: trigger factor, partial [Mycobacterium sp.]|nr:trigger factor [Mycobacterium sp.]